MSKPRPNVSEDLLDFDENDIPTTQPSLSQTVAGSIGKQNEEFVRESLLSLGIQPTMLAPIHRLTARMAADMISDKALWARQRELVKPNITQYAIEMLNGQWNGVTPISLAVLPNGEVRMFDGQHRCLALVKAGEEDPHITINVVFICYFCKDDDEIAALFENIDNPLASRNLNNYNRSRSLTDTLGIDNRPINALYDGILKAATGFLPAKKFLKFKDFARKERILTGEKDFIDYYYMQMEEMKRDERFKDIAKTLSTNSDILSVMFFLWRAQPNVTETLIERIALGGQPDLTMYKRGLDPVTMFVDWVRRTKDESIRGMGTSDWVYIMSLVWNAYARMHKIPGVLPTTGTRPRKNLAKINYNIDKTLDEKGKTVRVTPPPSADKVCFIGTPASVSVQAYREKVGDGLTGEFRLVDLSPTTTKSAKAQANLAATDDESDD